MKSPKERAELLLKEEGSKHEAILYCLDNMMDSNTEKDIDYWNSVIGYLE